MRINRVNFPSATTQANSQAKRTRSSRPIESFGNEWQTAFTRRSRAKVKTASRVRKTVKFSHSPQLDRTEEKYRDRKESILDRQQVFKANFRLGIIGMKVIGPNLRYYDVNEAFCRFVGYDQEEVLKLSVTDVAFPEERRSIRNSFEQLVRGDIPCLRFERRFRHKEGHAVWGFATNTVIWDKNGKAQCIIGQVVDMDNWRRVEKELKTREEILQHTQTKLRALANHLFTSGEEVKRTLARELHDVLSQRLASTSLRLSVLRKESSLTSEVRKELRSIGKGVQSLAYAIHDLSHRLHPSILEELGLVAALKREITAFSKQRKIRVQFSHHKVPKQLPSDLSLTLYRIAQESIQNIRQHAAAQGVKVLLRLDKGDILLAIEDDGRGFPRRSRKARNGLGLVSMEERAHLAGGTFSVASEPRKGTRVEVRIPWKGNKK